MAINPMPCDPAAYRALMASWTTGVAVATTRDTAGDTVGMTINSFTSVSLTPPLVLFCLLKTARSFAAFHAAPRFAVNLLAEDQESLSRHFAAQLAPPDQNVMLNDVEACPILANTLGWIAARKVAEHDAGDHVILVGEALRLEACREDAKPLVYFRRGYRAIT